MIPAILHLASVCLLVVSPSEDLISSVVVAGGASAPVREGARLGDDDTEIGIKLLPLKHAVASELASLLRPLAPKGSKIETDARSNTLLIKTAASNLPGLAAIVASLDVPVTAKAQPAPAANAAASEPLVTTSIAIVEMNSQKLVEMGVVLGSLGRSGLGDAAARRIADIADRGGDAAAIVHAHVTVPLSLGKRTILSRSVQYPTQTTSVAAGGVSQQGFGGYVSADNSLQILALPSGDDSVSLQIQYQVQQPTSTTMGPPVKSAQQGTLELVMRDGDLVVTGGRLAGGSDAQHLFTVVRVSIKR